MFNNRWFKTALVFPFLWVSAGAYAVEIDLSGSWQTNFDCSGATPGIIVVRSLDITENVTTGELTSATTTCGTIFLDGSIRVYSSCNSTPISGQISGLNFDVPTSGFSVDDSYFETPFASSTFGCISPPLARYVAEAHIAGTVDSESGGIATRLIGSAGLGLVQGYDSLDNLCSSVNFGGAALCTLVMLRNEVPTGANVSVEPLDGASITFDQADSSGVANITPLTEAAAVVPAEFQLADLPIFFDVTTSVAFTGNITVCVPYLDEDDNGFVDGSTPPIDENVLLILHEEGGTFVDRTVSRDTMANQICAEVSSLSQFVYGAGIATPTATATAMATETPTSVPIPTPASCPASPVSGCDLPAKSILKLKDKDADGPGAKDQILWKYIKGPAEPQSGFGDPTSSASLQLCVYDASGLALDATIAPPGGTCGSKPCWKAIGTKGYKYLDKTASKDGAFKVILKGDASKPKTKILFKGRDGALNFSASSPLLDTGGTISVRLTNTANANCWGADFAPGDVIKNTDELFKAKTP